MRLLADENFPKQLVDWIRSEGHDVLWARTHFAGMSDLDLLDLAESESRVLLTLDKDFRQIAVQRRIPLTLSGVVYFRGHPANCTTILPLVRAFLDAQQVWAGHVSTVSAGGIQMLALRKR
jgi:predicted nuclease of predicted toxin-antitoxin system